MYSEATAGFFRANAEAARPNNLRLVDPETPGTPGQDNGTLALSNGAVITHMQYIGKSGVGSLVALSEYQYPDGTLEPNGFPMGTGTVAVQAEFRKYLSRNLEQFEVDPVVSVTDDAGDFIVRHVGAGTIDYFVVSGVVSQMTRTTL